MADTAIATTTKPTESNRKTGLTDAIRTAFAGEGSLTDKARALYKAKPVATVALASVAGLAILGSLRGRG